jgi:hypothetical protein
MALWELMGGTNNDYSVLVYANEAERASGIFKTNGKPKQWAQPPHIKLFVDEKRKKQKPAADIGHLAPGSFILNEKAYLALKDFLAQFGECLCVNCEGEIQYFYNVTNLISCIDFTNSKKIADAVFKAVFLQETIPIDEQVFKDPLTANARIYVTEPAKATLEKLIKANALTGALFLVAGK